MRGLSNRIALTAKNGGAIVNPYPYAGDLGWWDGIYGKTLNSFDNLATGTKPTTQSGSFGSDYFNGTATFDAADFSTVKTVEAVFSIVQAEYAGVIENLENYEGFRLYNQPYGVRIRWSVARTSSGIWNTSLLAQEVDTRYYYALTIDDSGNKKVFRNGVQYQVSGSQSGFIPRTSGTLTFGNLYYMLCGAQFHSATLSDDQILENYEAAKERFSIP